MEVGQPKANAGVVEKTGNNEYRLRINGDGQEVRIDYNAVIP
jgi:hypothetical protein